MVGPAALSLHIARFLQSDPNAPMSPARWRLFPRLDELPFADACAALDSLPSLNDRLRSGTRRMPQG